MQRPPNTIAKFDFINDVRERPAVWQVGDYQKFNGNGALQVWSELAERHNTDVESVKRYWRSLRDRYVKQRRRVEESAVTMESADGGEPSVTYMYVPTWPLFRQLEFLNANGETRRRSTCPKPVASSLSSSLSSSPEHPSSVKAEPGVDGAHSDGASGETRRRSAATAACPKFVAPALSSSSSSPELSGVKVDASSVVCARSGGGAEHGPDGAAPAATSFASVPLGVVNSSWPQQAPHTLWPLLSCSTGGSEDDGSPADPSPIRASLGLAFVPDLDMPPLPATRTASRRPDSPGPTRTQRTSKSVRQHPYSAFATPSSGRSPSPRGKQETDHHGYTATVAPTTSSKALVSTAAMPRSAPAIAESPARVKLGANRPPCSEFAMDVSETLARLNPKQRSLAKLRIMQAMYDVEFGGAAT